MNVEKMLKLADYIENLPSKEKFNMGNWVSSFEYVDEYEDVSYEPITESELVHFSKADIFDCNTACCIAGWAFIYGKYVENREISSSECDCDFCEGYYPESYADFGANFLGLTTAEADRLFLPWHSHSVWIKYAKDFDYSYINIHGEPNWFGMGDVVDPDAISNKDAAYMLRGLATGKFNLSDIDCEDHVEYRMSILQAAYDKYNCEVDNSL